MSLVLFVLAILGYFYASFITGLAAWQLYQWFLIPLKFPNLNGWHIIGIALLVSLLRYKAPETKKDYNNVRTASNAIAEMIVQPPLLALITLCFGWVVAHFAGLL